jgi:hypothetical protein
VLEWEDDRAGFRVCRIVDGGFRHGRPLAPTTRCRAIVPVFLSYSAVLHAAQVRMWIYEPDELADIVLNVGCFWRSPMHGLRFECVLPKRGFRPMS